MVKRSHSATPSEDLKPDQSVTPPCTPEKPRPASSPKKTKSEGKGSTSKAFPAEAKRVLVSKAMDLAYRGLPWSELAQELDISESRLKDQFKPGRSNIRKTVLDAFAA
ncbi:hypothetical protein IAU60_000596 [Kwoniella sp. DSM 27419]